MGIRARGISPFTLAYFVLLRGLYVRKDEASISVFRRGVTSSITEMFRINVLPTGFTRKVTALVILRLHLVMFHELVTGRTFVH